MENKSNSKEQKTGQDNGIDVMEKKEQEPVRVQIFHKTRVPTFNGVRKVDKGVIENAWPELVDFARKNPSLAKVLK